METLDFTHRNIKCTMHFVSSTDFKITIEGIHSEVITFTRYSKQMNLEASSTDESSFGIIDAWYDNTDNIDHPIVAMISLMEILDFPAEECAAAQEQIKSLLISVIGDAVLTGVNNRGYHIWYVGGEWSYTVGLRSIGLPDLYISAGIPAAETSNLINDIVQRMKGGTVLGDIPDLLYGKYTFQAAAVDDPATDVYPEYGLGIPKFYNNHPEYDKLNREVYPEVVQILIPDKNNVLPTQFGYLHEEYPQRVCPSLRAN
jgi:hypothetical protein